MLYDDDIDYGKSRDDGSRRDRDARPPAERLDPRDLLDDLTALLEAGLIVPVRGDDGQIRVTPAEPLAWEERSSS